MAKLKLNPNPTFKAKVEIPVPGEAPVKVEFTFKHRTREEVQQLLEKLDETEHDVELVMKVASGWELLDDFNAENVRLLVDNYIASPKAIFEAYLQALTGARSKN